MTGYCDNKRFERLWFEYFIDLAASLIAIHDWHAAVGENEAVALRVSLVYCGLNVIYKTLSIEAGVYHLFHVLHSKGSHQTSYGTNIEGLIVGHQDFMLVTIYLTHTYGGWALVTKMKARSN